MDANNVPSKWKKAWLGNVDGSSGELCNVDRIGNVGLKRSEKLRNNEDGTTMDVGI